MQILVNPHHMLWFWNFSCTTYTVNLKSNELGFKEHAIFNKQSKIPAFFPSLTLLKYLASKKSQARPQVQRTTSIGKSTMECFFLFRNYVVEIQWKGLLSAVKKCLKCKKVGHPGVRLHMPLLLLGVGESKVLTCREKIIKREEKGGMERQQIMGRS